VGVDPRWIDTSDLPDELVALIGALNPSDHLVIACDGQPIAAISRVDGVGSNRGVNPSREAVGRSSTRGDDVAVVATAMALSSSARASLSEQLGPHYIVLDMNSAPTSADVLLIPAASPQLIGILRERFPHAKMIIAEIEDEEFGVSYRGPVSRLLDAGADSYLASTTIPHLATQLDHAVSRLNEIAAPTSTPPVLDVPHEQYLLEG